MELRISRKQGSSGMMSKKVTFIIEARAHFTPDESANIRKYKLGDNVIYNSEASRKHIESGRAAASSGTTGGAMKSLARLAMAKMSLNITIDSLGLGQKIECSTLDEAIAAEEAIREACEGAVAYIEAAAMFDGREQTFTFGAAGTTPNTGSGEALAY